LGIQWGWVPFWVSLVHRKMKGGSRFRYQVGPIPGVKNSALPHKVKVETVATWGGD